ncbi:Sulfite reductase [NADPH] flavoprotein alpha-component [Solibacillus isronensis B3W22]|uniref:assimilatory sulfite reductase (NADPH) n=1 Tax=Solibacillus isronensis B3W22 TaxID=1224748 RepID=K1KTC1_9BACL|nr:assimilatory sulfite reductase (NADPH) flavoprotein subunit [Solibacillus isronensis]AMO86265.1 sulfite reductase [NADPH] flavoprotein alpha-component [Solibacillus silvestris]EKB45736.1 Sulfite reductase [NADPH] flavoprotein alpha-component [Solibacillus isronensis B3W22]
MTLNLHNSPFSEAQTKLINELYPTLTDYQKVWLNGYLSAIQTIEDSNQPLEVTVTEQGQTVSLLEAVKQEATILYGSQTGNAQQVAGKLKTALESQGVEVVLSAMSDFKTNNLKKQKNIFIITSTHGEGDPPDNAISFHTFLYGKRAPKLEDVSFSVLSLGDSSYEFFCKTGLDFDEQLEKLGGKRIVPRVDCDLDYDDQVSQWIGQVVEAMAQNTPSKQLEYQNIPVAVAASEKSAYDKNNPFYAEVLESINLNGRGSNKKTQHLELSLEGSGLTYEPGDSVGILPENDANLVTALQLSLGFEGSEVVTVKNHSKSLNEALTLHFEITVLTKPLLQKLAVFSENDKLEALLEDDSKLKEYVYGRDLLDVVQTFGPFNWNAQQFVDQLRKNPVRLYSIASSQKANEEEVHLTIGKVFYEVDERERLGVVSGQVAERIRIGDKIPVYIHKNPNFRLPENAQTPIIMIGAGTGIAPYRSFLEERAEAGIESNAWLFFGDQHFVTDFLYQTELQRWLKDGTLTKLSVAFSRDTEQKVYVQHRLLEDAEEVYRWLNEGAVIYVCGDEKYMAHDVDQTLRKIVAEQGGKTEEEVTLFFNELKSQKRYQRDVY